MVKEGCSSAEESDSGSSIRLCGKRKKRFSEEQVRSLERIFETETTRLDPRKKAQVARELGLHPRQIAIWFQNRRARWKTKRIEKDYCALKADYGSLLARFESLKQEKQALLEEKLTDLARKKADPSPVQCQPCREPGPSWNVDYMDVKLDRERGIVKHEPVLRSVSSSESDDSKMPEVNVAERVGGGREGEGEGEEEIGLCDITGDSYGSFCLPSRLHGFEPSGCPGQSSLQWWDLWLDRHGWESIARNV